MAKLAGLLTQANQIIDCLQVPDEDVDLDRVRELAIESRDHLVELLGSFEESLDEDEYDGDEDYFDGEEVDDDD